MTDVDALPPTHQLVLEVLAARSRLGENGWTFHSRLRRILEALAQAGLIWWKHGVGPHTCLAALTTAGREAVLCAGYMPPAEIKIEWGARHDFGEDEKVRNFGEDGRQLSRDMAGDYAKAGQGGIPVCRRVIYEKWTEYPEGWTS